MASSWYRKIYLPGLINMKLCEVDVELMLDIHGPLHQGDRYILEGGRAVDNKRERGMGSNGSIFCFSSFLEVV